jgi:hypothetical protein
LFLGRLVESIDWNRIKRQATIESAAAWKWAVKSLAEAANLVYEYTNDESEEGVRGKGEKGQAYYALSRLRNRHWEEFATDHGEAPSHGKIAIQPHLGLGDGRKPAEKR